MTSMSKQELAEYRRKAIYTMIMDEDITDYEKIGDELGLSKKSVSRIVNEYLPKKVAKKVLDARAKKKKSE